MGRGTGSTAAAALLDAHGVSRPEAREATPLSKSEIIERAKAISVKVTCQLDGRSTDGRVCLRSGGAFVPDDKIIEACNREIPSGRFSGEALRMMYLQRSASHLNKHHIDLALRDCDEAAKIGEDSDNFRCRARIYVAMGALGRAITEWDEAVRVFPKDMIALSGRGGSFLARNGLAHAMADLDKAIEIDPEFANALWLRGAVHDKMRQHDRAVADFDRAIAIYDKLLKLYSVPLLRADLLAERANAYNAKGERDRAVADYDQAIALVPNRVSLIASRANVLSASNDRDRAIADLDRVIRLEPTNPKGFNDRGSIHRAKGDQDRAIADYDQAIHLDPNFAIAYYNRAIVYNMKGDRDRAIADYNEAIRLDPNSAIAFNNRGNVYGSRGDNDRALADYSDAIRLDSNFAIAFNNRGNVYRARGDNDRALADYSDAIRLDPKNAFAFRVRGLANLFGGSLAKALADLDQASALDPKNAYSAIWLDIITTRNNLPNRLSQLVSQVDMTKWPAPLVRLFMGELTPAAALAAADDADLIKKKGQVCEANFFSGELALRQGAKEQAARLFRLAAADCPRTFLEWESAKSELKALGEAP